MDSDSSLSILILILSNLLFIAASLAEAAIRKLCQPGDISRLESYAASPSIKRILSRCTAALQMLVAVKLVAITLIGVSLSVLAFGALDGSWLEALGLVIAGLFLLYLLQAVSYGAGRRYATRVAAALSVPLTALLWLFTPLAWFRARIENFLGNDGSSNGNGLTQGSIGNHAQVEEEVREADPEERRMIQAILHLEYMAAREVMVPRVDVDAAEVNTSLEDIAALMAQVGHSRVLVYRDSIDDVVGIVHARDVLQKTSTGEEVSNLEGIARPALFIPDSKPLDRLLREMQDRRATVAIVVDEYGGTEGLITMEDLLEEIVGEIEDEFTQEEPEIVRYGEHEAIIDGRVTLDEINEIFQTTLEGEGFDTLGGLLSTQLGKIPVTGDVVSLQGLDFLVVSTSGRRVRKVRVVKQTYT